MKKQLEIGTLLSGQKFTLPLELVTRTLGIIGIRGAGKTIAATVIAEEMCEAGLPWAAIDPVGVWWGLRVNHDGSPGGYPVVILGGEHGDVPIEKNMGRQVAEAILQQNLCCVIDLSNESKNTWRHFVTEFCDQLMELRPAVPRHVFIEEAPELVPQRPMGEQKRSLAAVDRLIRLGRNRGYGATLISQRFATIQKDVLTQCESLLALRSIGKPDRNAARDWIAECVGQAESEKKAEKFLESLAVLPDGEGWFWSPQWLDLFVRARIRHRKTYHPGETRSVGQAPKQVALSDVREFVEQFRKVLRPEAPRSRQFGSPVPRETALARGTQAMTNPATEAARAEDLRLHNENARLSGEISALRRELGAARAAIDAVRQQLEPEYRAMQKLFGELEAAGASSGGSIDVSVFGLWKEKLGRGPARMIDALISRGELTRNQIATLTGLSPRSGSFATYLCKLNSNGLIEKDGDKIRLRVP